MVFLQNVAIIIVMFIFILNVLEEMKIFYNLIMNSIKNFKYFVNNIFL